MNRPLRDLRNLGPRSCAMLAEIGVSDEAALKEIGAVEAYARLKFRFGPRAVTKLMLHALAGALADVDWRRLDAAHKAALEREAVAREQRKRD
ncbi:TfoX/Sxy family protein [Rhizobium sp. TRM95796]|uniref:TfoX/Sxy family protein n=1 Tax=Rhizobium sp. TRM95796 TaxID=2979862 RepID=UPI0021E97E80|nr:TfoX/Sxy family protein [Rhizobium sp. TRM95796]MCV3765872.1 TfoX/Sxy family protein [Rhizobium sp. TRM95796]